MCNSFTFPDRHFFLRKGLYVYCSVCGKRIMQDRYNYHKHLLSCCPDKNSMSLGENGDIQPLEENSYGYLFKMHRRVLSFHIYRLIPLFEQSAFPDAPWSRRELLSVLSGHHWEEIYQCTFFRNGTYQDKGEGMLDAYMTKIAEGTLRCITPEDPDAIVCAFLDDLDSPCRINTLWSFFRSSADFCLHRGSQKLFRLDAPFSPSPLSSETALALVGKKDCFTLSRENLDGKPMLGIIFSGSGQTDLFAGRIFAGADLLVLTNYTNLLRLASCTCMPNPEDDSTLKWFSTLNPQLHLDQYHGNFPLLPLLAPFIHPYLELLCKAGLDLIADYLLKSLLVGKEHLALPEKNGPTNLQQIFGLPLHILRKAQEILALPVSFFETLTAIRKLYAIHPALVEMPEYTLSYCLLITRNIFPAFQADTGCNAFFRQTMPCRQTQLPRMRMMPQDAGMILGEDDLLILLRYLVRLDLAFPGQNHQQLLSSYYHDSSLLGRFPEGKRPKDLAAAAERAQQLVIAMKNEMKEQRFHRALQSPAYAALAVPHRMSGSPYIIIQPESRQDMALEGQANHNCVETYTDAVMDGRSYILFVREAACPEKTLVTLEVSPRLTLIQAKAFGNARPSAEVQRYILSWAKQKHVSTKHCLDISIAA